MNPEFKIITRNLRASVVFGWLILLICLFSQTSAAENSPNNLFDFFRTKPSIFSPTSVFVVNTVADISDQLPGDGICSDGAGNCSLRGAIQEANAFAGANTIDFNIPGGVCPNTIVPATPLPEITESVTINGYSQPFATPNTAAAGSNALICVQLDGVSAGANADGLRISSLNTTVRGLAIFRFSDAGIEIIANSARVEGNFIGVNSGSDARPNRIGVSVFSSNNLIGGTTLISRNIISGNTRFGIALTEPASGNTVQNNYVGLGANSLQVANGESGINVFRAAGNTIGGTTAAARNVISGNGSLATGGLDGSGINVFGNFLGQAPNNLIQGNYLGTDPTGSVAIPNAHCGIFLNGAINTTIGGAAAGARNVISGNTRDGIGITGSGASNHIIYGNYIGLSANGAADLGNSSDGIEIYNVGGNMIGGAANGEGNFISGNNGRGILINGPDATGNLIRGNLVGTNAAGTAAVPNNDAGVLLLTNNNVIGGTLPGARNYFAGNGFGIYVALATGNQIQGNYVGISPTGATIGNGTGVVLDAANNNTVGGTVAGAGNVVSGNSNFGIRVGPYSGPPPTGNLIQGNLIGTNPSGTAAVANGAGILLQIAPGNTIGGTTLEARNVISGNATDGIGILNCNDNIVRGNYIGTTADGLSSVPNGNNGVNISTSGTGSSANNTIGGTAAGAGNLISGNALAGVQIIGDSDNNLLQANTLGLNLAENALPNGTSGVVIDGNAASGNVIGDATAGSGNVLSGNTYNGVLITGGANGNSVAGNKIGTNAAGTHARPNQGNGVHIISSPTNVIGGANQTFRNLISGNLAGGVRISGNGAVNNTISANYIGSNAAGNDYLLSADGSNYATNFNYGILIESPNNVIGGATSAARNVISGQFPELEPGIRITATGTGTLIRNNYIGTKADGSAALFNGQGIECYGNNATIDSNLISGSRYGIAFGSVNGGEITNNILGLNAAQSAFIPNGDAVVLTNTSNVRVGTTNAIPAPNVIAGNNFTGISIIGNGSSGNVIRQNSIYDNGDLGIDLGGDGVTPNDPGDPDFANNYQNYPIINAATTTISGSLNSIPNRSFRLEFYSSTTADPTGYGEGRIFLTSLNVTTNAVGNVTFSIANPQQLGSFISATATDLTTNDTSEFSPWKQTLAPTAVKFAGAQAKAFDNGVLLEWQTGTETDNLGFKIYREQNGKRVPVTPNLIAGSALLSEANLLSGNSYSFFDSNGDENTAYLIEAIDLNGSTETFGAIYAEKSSGDAPAQLNSPTLEKLGSTDQTISEIVFDDRKPQKPTVEQLKLQNILVQHEGVKLSVNQTGFYRATAEQLFANGLPANVNPANLRLFADGVEQPINVAGAEDGVFDAVDAIEFYGIAANSAETAARVYFLTAASEAGLRMAKSANDGQPANAAGFRATIERRERTVYFAGLLNGDEENFFGAVVTGAGANQTLNVSQIAPTGENAELEIALQGVTRTAHTIRVELNGTAVASLAFNEIERGTTRVSIPVALLIEGENSVRLIPGGAGDVSLVDFMRLTYSRRLRAENDALRFSATGGQKIEVDGFTSDSIRFFDVTEPDKPVELEADISKKAGGRLTFSASVTPAGTGLRRLVAVKDVLVPAEMSLNFGSNLRSTQNEADLLILTRRDFSEPLAPLAALRRSQGLSVQIVDVADIYDEFNFGRKSALAIKDFLRFAATSWRRRPQFVLLAGDATYDPKGYIFGSNADIVQTKLVDVEMMETAADDWFADFDGDGAAEISTGRIPAQNAAEMSAIVGKIIAYERQTPVNAATLTADVGDGFDFAGANQQVAEFLNQRSVSVTDIQRERDGETAKTTLLTSINNGQRFISYSGHAAAPFWRGNLLTAADARALNNASHLSLFVMMSCLNGYFTNPQTESLSEALMRNPQGGAIAVWASSGTTLPDAQAELHREFVRRLYAQPNQTLGQAVNAAKRVANQSVRKTWTLFGDPSMRLR